MTVLVEGEAGRIEGLLDVPEGDVKAAVVLASPHPRYGGSMRSRVLHEAARGFARAGAATFRFNYRGVGLSAGAFDEGRGERADFASVLDHAARTYPGVSIWAGGYSFGAWVGATAGAVDARITALLLLAPAIESHDFEPVVSSGKATFVVHAERDEFTPLRNMHRFYGRLSEPRELMVIDAADHAFDGKVSEVGDAIVDLFGDFA